MTKSYVLHGTTAAPFLCDTTQQHTHLWVLELHPNLPDACHRPSDTELTHLLNGTALPKREQL